MFACAQGRNVQVRWVKAHVGGKHLGTGAVETWHVLGNEIADFLAKSAAGLYPVAPAFVRSLVWTEDRARLIRARLYAIQKWHLEAFSATDVVDVEAAAVQSVTRQISKLVAHESLVLGKRKAEEADDRDFRGHPSHSVVQYSDFFVCTACGARARVERPVFKFLPVACRHHPATPYFKRTLDLMSKGRSLA